MTCSRGLVDAAQIAALALFIAAFALVFWAMR